VRASMAASREARPAVALAERSNIKPRGISTCHVLDLVLHEPCQDDLPTGAQERREPRGQGTQRSRQDVREHHVGCGRQRAGVLVDLHLPSEAVHERSEEHTSELQSPYDLVCRLLLEKKKKKKNNYNIQKHYQSRKILVNVVTW